MPLETAHLIPATFRLQSGETALSRWHLAAEIFRYSTTSPRSIKPVCPSSDTDLGSGGLLLVPDQPGSHPHELVELSKAGSIYLVDRDVMTANNLHYCSNCNSDSQIVEELSGAIGGAWSAPAYWNNNLYVWGASDFLKAYALSNGLISGTFTSKSANSGDDHGDTPIISSNGTANGIVWAIDRRNATRAGSAVRVQCDRRFTTAIQFLPGCG